MKNQIIMSRRTVLASGMALGATAFAPKLWAQEKLKVAGIHASPVENAWNSCLHKALQDAASEGVIEYVFSEGVSEGEARETIQETSLTTYQAFTR